MPRRNEAIDRDPAVRRIAGSLGIATRKDLKDAICAAAVHRVEDWMDRFSIQPQTLDDVHQLLLNQTRVKIVRVTTDEELERAASQLRRAAPAAPIQLKFEFARDTEAIVFKERGSGDLLSPTYFAVVDARGSRSMRAWFAERHEPSHILIGDPGVDQLWRRTKIERPEPVEQVVDAVASAVGFWRPITEPVFRAHLVPGIFLIDALETTRRQLAPESSRVSAYGALVGLLEHPALVLRAEYFSRREDETPGGDPMKSFALRAQVVVANSAAQRVRMAVWPRFRIPADSVISRTVDDWTRGTLREDDDLGRWRSESGSRLAARRVRVSARGHWAAIEEVA